MQTYSKKSAKRYLKNLIKSNKFIYFWYFWLVSFWLRFCGLFIKTNEKLILFVVYGGSRYDDSPRFVYEQMKRDAAFRGFKLVWAFQEPESVSEIKENKIKIDSFEYFKTALAAKYWITNSSVSRGLSFKKEGTIHIFFPHGMTAIKKIGNDIKAENASFRTKEKEKRDYIIIEGREEEKIIKSAWDIDSEVIYRIGLPRNDELYHCTDEKRTGIKRKLGIPFDRKVIMYAPTFREYKRDKNLVVYFEPPINIAKWKERLGRDYVLLIAGHYEIQDMILQGGDDFVINCFAYPHINDLMMVSDLLISDYSSIVFDYSILERPILAYAYDFEEYNQKRGVYPGYEEIFYDGIIKSEEELIQRIEHLDYDAESRYTRDCIKHRFLFGDGDASRTFVELFKKDIMANS